MIPYYRIEACMLTTVVLLLVMLPAPTNVVGAQSLSRSISGKHLVLYT